ncbi:MAG: hypothetical protein JJE30_13960 [Desulfuromonadales bacterium]|nr:hypothetical protein [Desulfuromonadales bacterium]
MILSLTPSGHLVMISSDESALDAAGTAPARGDEIVKSFAASPAVGIIALAGGKSAPDWPLPWMFWREFGSRYLLLLCQTQPTSERLEPLPAPDTSILAHLTLSIPPCRAPSTAHPIFLP